MTEQEIKENNELIAKFMGYTQCEDKFLQYSEEILVHPNGEYYNKNQIKYHSDWNWLMSTVEKINQLPKIHIMMMGMLTHYKVTISQNQLSDEFQGYSGWPQESFIEATWIAVLGFIKYYNENKK